MPTTYKPTQISVYFRAFPEGDVIALWKDGTERKGLISSYQHIGQHSEASQDLVNTLRKATTGEKAALIHELASIGYRIMDADEWVKKVANHG